MGWIRRFISFNGKRHPSEIGEEGIKQFLTHLAAMRNVAASTQNQALAGIIFLYKEILGLELEWLDGFVRSKRPVRLPVVLNRTEVASLLREMTGTPLLMASLLYGSGLRTTECARLRIKDIDLERREIFVRRGKGRKDRVTVLPARLAPHLLTHSALCW